MRVLLFRFTGLLVLASSLAVGWVGFEHRAFLRTPVTVPSGEVIFEIEPGTGVRNLVSKLVEHGLIDEPLHLLWAIHRSSHAQSLKAGEYRLTSSMTPVEVIELFASGQVVQHALTVIDGWTFRDLRAAVRNHPKLAHTVIELGDDVLMERIGAGGEHPEGWFLPETYFFPAGTTDAEFLKRAHVNMARTLREEWDARSTGLPLESPYEALILASIVEKETGRADERARIAGVFVRRMQAGMRLQTDPTVIYGLGESFDGNLTRAHLRGATPYNTYVISGLPPTPIAMPGRSSINAVMHPEAGRELFFVARGDGSHQFSVTYDEHRQAVARYQLSGGRATRPKSEEGGSTQ